MEERGWCTREMRVWCGVMEGNHEGRVSIE